MKLEQRYKDGKAYEQLVAVRLGGTVTEGKNHVDIHADGFAYEVKTEESYEWKRGGSCFIELHDVTRGSDVKRPTGVQRASEAGVAYWVHGKRHNGTLAYTVIPMERMTALVAQYSQGKLFKTGSHLNNAHDTYGFLIPNLVMWEAGERHYILA